MDSFEQLLRHVLKELAKEADKQEKLPEPSRRA